MCATSAGRLRGHVGSPGPAGVRAGDDADVHHVFCHLKDLPPSQADEHKALINKQKRRAAGCLTSEDGLYFYSATLRGPEVLRPGLKPVKFIQ